MSLRVPAVAAILLATLGLANYSSSASAATNIVVLNATSGNLTVSCNNTGNIPPGNGTWSCVDAHLITSVGDSYTVRDTHSHNGCSGGAWNIQYIHNNNNRVLANACTHLGFAQIGCHTVEVTDQGLRVHVEGSNNACAGKWFSQFGVAAFNQAVAIVEKIAPLLPK